MKLNTILHSRESLYIQRLTPHYMKTYSLLELNLQNMYQMNVNAEVWVQNNIN